MEVSVFLYSNCSAISFGKKIPEVTPEVTPETTPTTTPETTPTATPAPIGDDELATIYVDNITDHDACIHIKLNSEMIREKYYD